MDELDLYDTLSPSTQKTAGVKDSVKGTMKAVREWVSHHGKSLVEGAKEFGTKNKDDLVGGTIGAGVGTAGTYLAHKKNKKTGKSPSQRLTHAAARKAGPPSPDDVKSYPKGVAKAIARAAKDVDDVSAEHPRKAAVSQGVPLGAAVGSMLYRQLRKK